MNNIDEMPAKCKACPYWEACEYPGICQDTEPKTAENGNINAGIAENLQNRPTNGDLISRQAAIDALTTYIYNIYKVMEGKTLPMEDCGDAAESVLDELPTVQPKHGKWIDMPYDPSHTKYMCSECGKTIYTNSEYIKEHKFCFSCGADMRCSENPNS